MQASTELSVIIFNQKAMQELRLNHINQAFSLLEEALRLTISLNGSSDQSKLYGVTYNNIGILYQRMGNLPKGLHYLSKSLEFEQNNIEALSATLLNMSKLLSEQGSHKESLEVGLKCIRVLKNNFEASDECIRTLIVAYHNVGKEYEHLRIVSAALDCYLKGYHLALEHLGVSNLNTLKMHKAYVTLKKRKTGLGRTRSNSKSRKKVFSCLLYTSPSPRDS